MAVKTTLIGMTTLKGRLESDLHAAMKSRDELVTSTLRMALTAIRNEEVAGKAARELRDEEVLAGLSRETKKRREAATAFADAGRTEMAEKERAEEGVLTAYLPAQMSDEGLPGARAPRAPNGEEPHANHPHT